MRPAWMCLLFALAACNGEEPVDPVPVSPEQVVPEPDGPETTEADPDGDADPWDGLEGFDKARSLTAARQFRDAVKELEPLLGSEPSNTSVWLLLSHAAKGGGESSELLDRLDAGTAIGGQEISHWMLRCELALDADRPADALDSARKLAKADPELGAVYTVRAIQAGASFDTGNLDAKDPNDALVIAGTQKGGQRARSLGDTSPKTWQGLLLRAELWESTGDAQAALSDRRAAASNDDPYAHVAAGAELVAQTDDKAEAAEQAADAARSATDLGLAVSATDFTLLATDLYIGALQPAEALAFATEMRDLRESAKDGPGSAWTNIAVARAAQANGQVDIAVEAASSALAWAETQEDDGTLGAASLELGKAAWLAGLDEPLVKAAANVDDKDAFEALAKVLTGDAEGALGALSRNSSKGSTGVLIQLAAARAAWASGQSALPHIDKAIKLADASGHLPDRVATRLEKDRYARAEGASTRSVLGELSKIANELDSDPLRAEVAVRTAMSGGQATLPEGVAGDWAAVLSGVDIEGDSLPAQFGRARALAADGRFDKAYDTYHAVYSDTPTHHRGPWAPASVLTGVSGPGIDGDLKLLLNQRNAIPAGLSLLVIHEWWHAVSEMDVAFQVGDDPSVALEAEERAAYNAAHRHLQARSVLWLCGSADEPADAQKALADADAKAMEDSGFARSMSPELIDYRALREGLGPVAILSYRLGPKSGEALAITKSNAYGLPINPSKVNKAADSLLAQLRAGVANGGGEVSPAQGDLLRSELIDPFQQVISGTARYLVVPDGNLWKLSISTLPEQQSGRRFLADIRTITYSTTVASAFGDSEEPVRKYMPEYVGLSVRPDSQAIGLDGTRIATETENSGRHFMSDKRIIHSGEGVTGAVYNEQVPKARFIHLTEVTAGPRGAITFGDGDSVTLSEVREKDLWALVAIVIADVEPRVARRWTQAYHAAGVPDVITSRWITPLQPRSKYFFAFFENYMQEGEVPRAITGARNVLTGEEGVNFGDPSWWGPYFLSGKP